MTDKPLAKRKPNELRDLIEGTEFRAQLAKALPNAMSPERFVRITATSMMRNPRLLQCTRETFFRCLLDLSAIGLEPDGRRAYLIPRKNKVGGIDCTLIIGYQGIKELLYRNHDIIDEHSDCVGDLDHFEFEYGSEKHLVHRPNVHGRGRIYAAYSHITLPKGGQTFDVMSVEEIEAVRKRSSSPEDGPWKSDWAEMAKKTVFRRVSKGLPLSPKTRDAMEIDQTYDLPEPAIVTPTRAVIGGKRQNLPEFQEELPEEEALPTDPFGDLTSPPEPVQPPPEPVKPPSPLTRMREALKQSGFRPVELIAMFKSLNFIGNEIDDITKVPGRKLEEALDDWENCLIRLAQGRAGTQPQQEEFPA